MNGSLLPPPHLPSRSKSVANVHDSSHPFLPAPRSNKNEPQQQQQQQNNQMVGRRVAATVKFDLKKTSQGETVIKTTELLEDIFNPIYNILLNKNNDDDDEYEENKKDDDFKLYDNKTWNKVEINKCLNRFLSVLIEYTRTMHRIRLKLSISISMLLIGLLRHSNKLYTLHQLFQYHAFPDDEKLAMELLDISASSKGKWDAGKQLGIDMLLRLGRWSKICKILLDESEIETGVRLFLQKYPFDKKNNIEKIQLSDFLNKALQIDPIRFYHVYQGLDMIISSHHSVFSYYSDYYTQSLYGGDANDKDKDKNKKNGPGANGQRYGYNNNSRATNLHVLFSDEMNNFKTRFDILHSKFSDDDYSVVV